MIDEIPSLDTNMTSKYSGDLKKKLDNILAGYNKIATEFEQSKAAHKNRMQDIKAKDQANNLLSKKYRQSRLNDNIRLSGWLISRYDSEGKIRTSQTESVGGQSAQYQYRINRLCNFYHRRTLFDTSDLTSFNNWYKAWSSAVVVIDSDINTMHFEAKNETIDFQDMSLEQLTTNTYPQANVAFGYSSAILDNYGNEIYQLSKYQYVIDYPNNIAAYTYSPVIYSDSIGPNPYANIQSIKYSLYQEYRNIMGIRNGIISEYLNNRNKRKLQIQYINDNLVQKKSEINRYNVNLSTYIRNWYLSEASMNGSVYDQLELNDSFIWCSEVIDNLSGYRNNTYPPAKDGTYGDNFFQTYTFE